MVIIYQCLICLIIEIVHYLVHAFRNFSIIIAPQDYNSTSLTVTFSSGESEKLIRVPIINDLSREESETFYGNLTFYHQSELLQQVQFADLTASIEILYNDCKSKIQ